MENRRNFDPQSVQNVGLFDKAKMTLKELFAQLQRSAQRKAARPKMVAVGKVDRYDAHGRRIQVRQMALVDKSKYRPRPFPHDSSHNMRLAGLK